MVFTKGQNFQMIVKQIPIDFINKQVLIVVKTIIKLKLNQLFIQKFPFVIIKPIRQGTSLKDCWENKDFLNYLNFKNSNDFL